VTAGRGKQTFRAPLADLSPGTIVEHEGDPYLLWRSGWFQWTPRGYETPSAAPWAVVEVLTRGRSSRCCEGDSRRRFIRRRAGQRSPEAGRSPHKMSAIRRMASPPPFPHSRSSPLPSSASPSVGCA
jgi:hypothetical protein